MEIHEEGTLLFNTIYENLKKAITGVFFFNICDEISLFQSLDEMFNFLGSPMMYNCLKPSEIT